MKKILPFHFPQEKPPTVKLYKIPNTLNTPQEIHQFNINQLSLIHCIFISNELEITIKYLYRSNIYKSRFHTITK